jgi:hypothetical protein
MALGDPGASNEARPLVARRKGCLSRKEMAMKLSPRNVLSKICLLVVTATVFGLFAVSCSYPPPVGTVKHLIRVDRGNCMFHVLDVEEIGNRGLLVLRRRSGLLEVPTIVHRHSGAMPGRSFPVITFRNSSRGLRILHGPAWIRSKPCLRGPAGCFWQAPTGWNGQKGVASAPCSRRLYIPRLLRYRQPAVHWSFRNPNTGSRTLAWRYSPIDIGCPHQGLVQQPLRLSRIHDRI